MRSRALALIATLFLVVGLAACGSDGGTDAKATTTTAAGKTTTTAKQSSPTTEAGGATTTTAAGGETTTSIKIPSEKPNAAFCEGFKTVDSSNSNPSNLAQIKAYYKKVQAAIEQMRDNAPDELKDGLSKGADLLDRANARIQTAKSEDALKKDKELEKIFNTNLSLNDVEAYGTKNCK